MPPSKPYLLPTIITCLFSWLAVVIVVEKINPYESTKLGLPLFFISLFFALVSTFTILGFYIRTKVNNHEIIHNSINISFRQAILLSFCALGCLMFLLLGFLTWWNSLLMILIVVLIELYFTSQD